MSLSVEQLERRKHGIGASEVAAICGVGYGSPHDVWMRKMGLAETEPNSRMRWGSRVEATVADWYEEHHDVILVSGVTEEHPQYPWALATPDRFVRRRKTNSARLLEIKSRGEWARNDYGEPGTDQCSLPDFCQVSWALFVTGFEWCDVAVTFSNEEPVVYTVRRDEEVIAGLFETVRAFWFDYVVPQVEPPATPAERLACLEARYPSHTGPLLAAPPEAERWAELYQMARSAKRVAERQEAEAKAALCALIADGEGLEGEGWRCTWRQSKGQRAVDYAGLLAELRPAPELVARFSREKPGSRRFLFRASGEGAE